MDVIKDLELEETKRLTGGKKTPAFGPGDTVRVNVRIKEGERERVQAFEGVCIGRSGGGLQENFTVRKISFGEGVERVFPVLSPMIESIEVKRRGAVRRAKLYYLCGDLPRQVRPHRRTRHGRGTEGRGADRGRRVIDEYLAGRTSQVSSGAPSRCCAAAARLLCTPLGAASYFLAVADHQCTCGETAAGDAEGYVFVGVVASVASFPLGSREKVAHATADG